MDADPPESDGGSPIAEAISWIEAALQAGLGEDEGARIDRLRQALRTAVPPEGDGRLEAWLEAVALELDQAGAAGTPNGLGKAAAARLLAHPSLSRGAHRNIEARAVRNLLPRD
jgi:hypothetical protein